MYSESHRKRARRRGKEEGSFAAAAVTDGDTSMGTATHLQLSSIRYNLSLQHFVNYCDALVRERTDTCSKVFRGPGPVTFRVKAEGYHTSHHSGQIDADLEKVG
jgi:hypothetical protein